MIKGILLKSPPIMRGISETDILSSLDPLKEYESKYELDSSTEAGDVHTTRRVFYTDKLYIVTYTTEKVILQNLWEVYDTLTMAAPDIIKAFRKGDAVFVSYPKFEDKFEDATYSVLIDELVRVTAFFCREFDKETAVNYVKDYVDLCVAWNK
jgi:hypothetical protein